MGEFDFIDKIRHSFEGIGDPAIAGIGDDCAVIPVSGASLETDFGAGSGSSFGSDTATESFVVTADMLVEGVHFLRHATSARELGRKSIAVNLSDIAAMGARPVASFLSIALPPECRGEWAEEFMDGYRELSARHNVKLAGGDTTGSLSGVVVNVTVIGRAPTANLKFRGGARPGDIVVVGGTLGESAAGLQDILAGRLDTPFAHIHRNPVAQVSEGEWLGTRPEVHSMIDLSDGLASDLLHILHASSDRNGNPTLAAEIELDAIPVFCHSGQGREADDRYISSSAIELALTGGEDYKLLFTVSPEGWDALRGDYEKRFGAKLYATGRIVSGLSGIVWLENGTPVTKNFHGFTHF